MRFGFFGLWLLAAFGHAAGNGADVEYEPPDGFAGHRWGEVRAAFHRLPDEPIGVGAAWMRRKERQLGYSCQYTTQIPKYVEAWIDQCKWDATLLHGKSEFKGGGSYVLSEYSIKGQGFRFGDESGGVVLSPVIYQFCANWQGRRDKRPPGNFADLNRFCGMKFQFKTPIGEELRNLPVDQATAYDRVLELLIGKYGRPKGYTRRGKVYIDTVDNDVADADIHRFNTWRWCPAVDDGLRTDCKASVTLALDPVTGTATIYYTTPVLWEFAFARFHFGFDGDPLFKALHALE